MFLAPAFFLGLLAIAIPVWLHRVARANPTRHRFASLMLLEASDTQKTAKRTLRYWLLLALRIALLIALVLAFAGLLVPPRAVPTVNADARLHAIVLDTSFSMQHGDRWKKALDAAEGILAKLRTSDRVMLVAGAGRRIQIVQEAVSGSEVGVVRAAMRSLEPGIDRLDYGLMMSTSNGWLGEPRLPTELHVISDLQQTASPLRFADLAPPTDAKVVMHDVGDGESSNVFVQDAALTALDSRTLEVRVAASGSQPERRDVVLAINGKEQGRRAVEFAGRPAAPAAGGSEGGSAVTESRPSIRSEVVQFPELDLAAGTHRVEVRLEPADQLAQDDRFFAAIEHADPKVMLVSRAANADEAAYFGAAIESLTAPRLAVERSTVSEAEARALNTYSAVVVADSGALSSAAAERIREYVASGGALLATLGVGATSERGEPLSDLRIREIRSAPASVGFVEASHPALRDANDWHSVRFFRHAHIEPAPDDRVLIALDDGSPLLLERSVGAGRMLLLTAPLDRNWNDLAVHPLFVRFISEVARYLTGQDALAASARVGTAVTTGLTAASGGQIFDPQGQRVLNLADTTHADRLIPEQTGFYEVRSGQGVRWIAVNVDARESDLSRMPLESLRRWEGLRTQAPVTPAEPLSAATPKPEQPRSLGYLILLLAALLVLIEFIMGNHYLSVRREVPG
jgi:hypothetical protein